MKPMNKVKNNKGFLLGVTTDHYYVYLQDFSWDCGWYWGGGYVQTYYKNNSSMNTHTHFDSLFFNGTSQLVTIPNGIRNIDVVRNTFAKSSLTENEWWRLMDLMKQFYAHKESASAFHMGGHYTSTGRTKAELSEVMCNSINLHIKENVIPEIQKLLAPIEE